MSNRSQGLPSVTTSAGLRIRTLRSSQGTRLANGDRVWVYYAGSLTDGTPFDANYNFEGFQPIAGRRLFDFTLGAGQVIQGWDQGLRDRRLGEVLELTIPAELAYGSKGAATIPPNADLIFRVVLVGQQSPGQPSPNVFALSDLGIDVNALALNTRQTTGVENLVLGTDLPDLLSGTTLKDCFIGFSGRDRFRFSTLEEATPGRKRDLIINFRGGRKGDQVDLQGIDANNNTNGDQRFQFIGRNAFSGAAGELRYARGILQGDVNGDRKADLELDLVGAPSLGITNFLL